MLIFSRYFSRLVCVAEPVLESELHTSEFKKIIHKMAAQLNSTNKIEGITALQVAEPKKILMLSAQRNLNTALSPFLLFGAHKPLICILNPLIMSDHTLTTKAPSTKLNGLLMQGLTLNNDLKMIHVPSPTALRIHALIEILDGRSAANHAKPKKPAP